MMNHGMTSLGTTVGTGIRIRNHVGTLKNCLQDLAPRHFWSKLRLVSSSAAGTVQTLQSPLPPQGSVSAVTSQPSKTLT